jgi:hypothetical protein
MKHPVKSDGDDGRPLNRRQQDSSKRIPLGCAEAAFQRLTAELPIETGMGRLIDIDSFRLNQTAPVSLHNFFTCPSDTWISFYFE